MLISTLGEIPDKPAALSELRRVLKPGARLGVTEEMLFTTYQLGGSARRWPKKRAFAFSPRAARRSAITWSLSMRSKPQTAAFYLEPPFLHRNEHPCYSLNLN